MQNYYVVFYTMHLYFIEMWVLIICIGHDMTLHNIYNNSKGLSFIK